MPPFGRSWGSLGGRCKMDGDFFESARSLKEILLETKDGEWGKDQADDGLVEMIVIRGTDFGNARQCELSRIPRRFIPQKAADRKILQPNDILIETAGGSKGRPTGRTVFLRPTLFECSPLPITCASFARFLRVDTALAAPEYVYWFLQALYASGEIERHQVQHSGIARFQYTKFAAETLVPLPSREHQRDIAEFLGLVERRITLLRETNATLEAIAQALFKSWFVDFDPLRAKAEGREPEGVPPEVVDLFPDELVESELGMIPKGWRCLPFSAVCDAVGGSTPSTKEDAYWEGGMHCWATPKDLSGVEFPVLLDTERRITDQGLEKISSGLLPAGTVLMSSRAPIGYLAIAEVPVAINQGFIAMKPKDGVTNLFLLQTVKNRMEEIKSRANGSTFMEISKAAFRPIPMLVPPTSIVSAYDALARSLYGRLVANVRQSKTLADLRDTLLPRLMSGKLRITEAEKELEAV